MTESTYDQPPTASEQLALEKRLLKRAGWVFPVLGLLVTGIVAKTGWFLVTLDPDLVKEGTLSGWNARHVLIAVSFGLIPLIWRLCIWIQERQTRLFARVPMAVLLALLCVVAAEGMVQHRLVQVPLWLGLRARLMPGIHDFFPREVAYIRLAVLDDKRQPGQRALIFSGTSQVLQNFDFDLLREGIGHTVLRRALAGFIPFKLCAGQEYLSLREGDTLVLYVSEFDMTGMQGLDVNALRPVASWQGTRDAVGLLPTKELRRSWRGVLDLALASGVELWRIRDSASHILHHPLGPSPLVLQEDLEKRTAIQAEQYKISSKNEAYVEVNMAALETLLRRAQEIGMDGIILEGRINPVMETSKNLALRPRVRDRVKVLAEDYGFEYVPVEDQGGAFESADWLDGTHLTPDGARKYTGRVIDILVQHGFERRNRNVSRNRIDIK